MNVDQKSNIALWLMGAGVVSLLLSPLMPLLAVVGIGLLVYGYKYGKKVLENAKRYTPLTPQERLERDKKTLRREGLGVASNPRVVEFDYVDAEGNSSRRTVTVTGFNREYLRGFCHFRDDYRTFRFDRVVGGLVDTSTGEVLTANAGSLR